MSIIYDALKKTEAKTKDIEEKIKSPKPNNFKFLRVILVLCILIIVGLAVFFIGKPSKSPTFSPGTKLIPKIRLPTPVKTSASKKTKSPVLDKDSPFLSLNGIIFSDGQYSALINGKIVEVGDFIEGAQIHKVDSEGVEIKIGESSFRLDYP